MSVYIEPLKEDPATIAKRNAFYAQMISQAKDLGGTYRIPQPEVLTRDCK
jgi:hypothetical protein